MNTRSDAADVDVDVYVDDCADDVYVLDRRNQTPRMSLNVGACVYFSLSDAYCYLSFRMDSTRTQTALASFSCVASALLFPSSHSQRMIHSLHRFLFLHPVEGTVLYACSYWTTSFSSSSSS